MPLAEYIKNLREGMTVDKVPTIKDVSEKSGIPLSTLDFIERGLTKRPSDETLEKLAEYYKVEKKDLVSAMYDLDESSQPMPV